jgi:hypothetical protein
MERESKSRLVRQQHRMNPELMCSALTLLFLLHLSMPVKVCSLPGRWELGEPVTKLPGRTGLDNQVQAPDYVNVEMRAQRSPG